MEFASKPASEAQGSGEADSAFNRFSKLPRELRFQIWELSAPPPQPIEIKFKSYLWSKDLCIARYKVPTLLHVNQESRSIGETIYKQKFADRLRGGGIWTDTSKDVLHFSSWNAVRMFFQFDYHCTTRTYYLDEPLWEKIPALAFHINASFCFDPKPEILHKMGQPQTVYYIESFKPQDTSMIILPLPQSAFQFWLNDEWINPEKPAWFKFFEYDKPKAIKATSTQLSNLLASLSPPVPKKKRGPPEIAKAYLENTCFELMH